MQFRILKRDNQICSVCQNPVLDADIHFDHIIPWSKGGQRRSTVSACCAADVIKNEAWNSKQTT